MEKITCRKITVTGTVQGVGFRPFVYNLARRLGLGGTVRNTGQGVSIEIEGKNSAVEEFTAGLQSNPPRLARVDSFRWEELPRQGHEEFRITATGGNATGESVVPPDVATCTGCRREILDPEDRHYRYPFTNCTACGPRFTITRELPYDRPRTSMAAFPMCSNCRREYSDPGDRRFHAQPAACPDCGPRAYLADHSGRVTGGDWLPKTRQLLHEGNIIAIKSLGGFHLACSGTDPAAITKLRRRKARPFKPLAVMCRDLAAAKKYCLVSAAEAALLCSPRAPIVLLQKKLPSSLPEELAPGLNTVGVMLPYTPLHILLAEGGPEVLVMTSGNASGLPLARDNAGALAELDGSADFFLLHNRDIVNRCDDSVARVAAGKTQFFRRSRGYVPEPVSVPAPAGESINKTVFLGAGADLKNTFCLLQEGRAYPGPHIGSLDTLEGEENYGESLENFCRLLQLQPSAVALDLHPGYRSSALARALECPFQTGVQHHHAHMASCMAENNLEGPVTGIILDGTGYGTDGKTWGFEILTGDYLDFTREYHLQYLPLPGGDSAVLNPRRTAVAYLLTALGEGAGARAAEKIFPGQAGEIALVSKMIRRGVNTPLASSCGRLFDAVSALLGICSRNTYDGQAPAELSARAPAVMRGRPEPYPFRARHGTLETGPLVRAIASDLEKGTAITRIAGRFQDTVVKMAVDCAGLVRESKDLHRVVLSGGSWHNRYLLEETCRLLGEQGFQVYTHAKIPPGDGGLSLGQAVIACHRFAAEKLR